MQRERRTQASRGGNRGACSGVTSWGGAHRVTSWGGAHRGDVMGRRSGTEGCSPLRLPASALDSTCERRPKVGAWSGHKTAASSCPWSRRTGPSGVGAQCAGCSGPPLPTGGDRRQDRRSCLRCGGQWAQGLLSSGAGSPQAALPPGPVPLGFRT